MTVIDVPQRMTDDMTDEDHRWLAMAALAGITTRPRGVWWRGDGSESNMATPARAAAKTLGQLGLVPLEDVEDYLAQTDPYIGRDQH